MKIEDCRKIVHLEDDIKRFAKAYKRDPSETIYEKYEGLLEEYCALSCFFQTLFISENGYIIDTGNFRDVNRELVELVLEKVEKNPTLFRKLFEVA